MDLSPTRRMALAGLAATLVPLNRAQAQAGPLTLDAAPLTAKLGADLGSAAELWAFNGKAAPPVLRIRHGEELRVRLKNGLAKPLSLHWHGVRGPAAQDGVGGVSHPPVQPGGRVRIPADAARARAPI